MPGWAKCQLEVLECEEISWPSPEVEATYRVQNAGWERKKSAYECKVKLITGRTHQVSSSYFQVMSSLQLNLFCVQTYFKSVIDESMVSYLGDSCFWYRYGHSLQL